MEKRTAYVANYMDRYTWEDLGDDPDQSWYDATYPICHPLVLVADMPTDEWLDEVKKDAVEEYLDSFDIDDEVPTLTWTAKDPATVNWSQEHAAMAQDGELCLVLVVRRIEVAIA